MCFLDTLDMSESGCLQDSYYLWYCSSCNSGVMGYLISINNSRIQSKSHALNEKKHELSIEDVDQQKIGLLWAVQQCWEYPPTMVRYPRRWPSRRHFCRGDALVHRGCRSGWKPKTQRGKAVWNLGIPCPNIPNLESTWLFIDICFVLKATPEIRRLIMMFRFESARKIGMSPILRHTKLFSNKTKVLLVTYPGTFHMSPLRMVLSRFRATVDPSKSLSWLA